MALKEMWDFKSPTLMSNEIIAWYFSRMKTWQDFVWYRLWPCEINTIDFRSILRLTYICWKHDESRFFNYEPNQVHDDHLVLRHEQSYDGQPTRDLRTKVTCKSTALLHNNRSSRIVGIGNCTAVASASRVSRSIEHSLACPVRHSVGVDHVK